MPVLQAKFEYKISISIGTTISCRARHAACRPPKTGSNALVDPKGYNHKRLLMTVVDSLQAAVALLQKVCSQEETSAVTAGSSSEGTTKSKHPHDHAAACASPAASSSGSFSDAAEGLCAPGDTRQFHQFSIGPKDPSAEDITPAERYCQWIHHNVHGQDMHSLASLTKSDTSLHAVIPTQRSDMTGEGVRAESLRGCLGDSCTVAACSVATSAEMAGAQASCTTASLEGHQRSLKDQSKLYPQGARSLAHVLHMCVCRCLVQHCHGVHRAASEQTLLCLWRDVLLPCRVWLLCSSRCLRKQADG